MWPLFEFCWMWNFPWIKLTDTLVLCETDLDDSIDSGNFSVTGYLSIIWMDSVTEGRTSFCMGLISKRLYRFLLMFSTGFTTLSVSFLFSQLITSIFIHGFWFYFIYHRWGSLYSSSLNVFVFGDFSVHHKNWLTWSGGTDRPGELC